MRILETEEIYYYKNKKDDLLSLYSLTHNEDYPFIPNEIKKDLAFWINKINYIHHSESDFFKNYTQMFSIENKSQVIMGQEDIAGAEHKDIIFIIRQSDMGVSFSLMNKDCTPITKEKLNDIQEAILILDIGFGNYKNFHSKLLFDKINEEVDNKQNIKNKIKI